MIGYDYNDFDIQFNEEEQVYELYIEGSLNYKGSMSEVEYHLAEYFFDNDDWDVNSTKEAVETARECISMIESDEDLNAYMLNDLSDDLKGQTKLQSLVLDFACDVLEIMRTAEKELFGADADVRPSIRCLAFNDIQEKIDKYADKLQNMEDYDE